MEDFRFWAHTLLLIILSVKSWYKTLLLFEKSRIMIRGYLQAGRFEYACKACGHKAGAKRNLRKHMRSLHPSFLQVSFQRFPIEPILDLWEKLVLQYNRCPSCEFTTPWKDSLRHHEKQHELPDDWSQVVCHHCPFFYRYCIQCMHTRLYHIWGAVNLRMHISSDTTP